MLETHLSDQRGTADHGWLKAKHSFSFANYYNPRHMGFGPLRVINDDRIAPSMGFGTHGHENMEIITYVMSGELSHRDSMGNQEKIPAGEVQKMSAGRGVRHSEFNSSDSSEVHLLQIWIEPNVQGIAPEYEQFTLDDLPLTEGWRVIAAPNGKWHDAKGAMRLYQDAALLCARATEASSELQYVLDGQRAAYIHVATGSASVNGMTLHAGDAVKVWDESLIKVELHADAQVLLFDLPRH
ncbi:pirin family protein [Hydromonas duriensis]|uniref:Pirin N-terminal domain-containing protein n=1 Tax=Hydromonas duriensis TaxID=1527608 RepID=A0A4R6Y7I0_9BURK|nr:pirin family protein [Hydromonas duriensis]TDR31289.1 hypothetical protein DFR44_11153 [Hydromonas duriensis]